MTYYFAPMEGITTAVYRRIHHKYFPGAARYYAPFISPTSDHCMTPREFRELAPEHNDGIELIPQILTKNAEDFLWAAGVLADMGYTEINLNLGCPSATVTAKGKGAGLLLSPDALKTLLDGIFSRTPVRVSVKTRIGYHDPNEWETLLGIYNVYPIAELIVHPRTRKEMYAAEPHCDAFSFALERSDIPIAYNGNLFTAEDCRTFAEHFPAVPMMLGRGAVVDPALFRTLASGAPITKEELFAFHSELYAAYREELGAHNAMRKMKELWLYMIRLFADNAPLGKKIARSKDILAFEAYTAEVFQTLSLAPIPQKPVYRF